MRADSRLIMNGIQTSRISIARIKVINIIVVIVKDKLHVASDILTDIYCVEMTPPSSKIEHDGPSCR